MGTAVQEFRHCLQGDLTCEIAPHRDHNTTDDVRRDRAVQFSKPFHLSVQYMVNTCGLLDINSVQGILLSRPCPPSVAEPEPC